MAAKKQAFVIGGGSAGTTAAITLADAGWEVKIAEPGGLGGTCLWAGCVPKKSLFVTSMALRARERDAKCGVESESVTLNWKQALAWKRRSQTDIAGDQEAMIAERGVEHVPGAAKFLSEDEVEAAGEVYRADAIVIATGARTTLPDIPGVELADTSGSALAYRTVPSSLAIIGGGYIAMEFAAAYALLGTEVTMIVRGSRLLPTFDSELVEIAKRQLAEIGVEFMMHTQVSELTGQRGDAVAHVTDGSGKPAEARFERVLAAIGRHPNVAQLDLDAAGVETNERGGVLIDDAQRTTNPRVWACGDAAATIQLKPSSEFAGRLVARSIITGTPHPVVYEAVPTTVFTLPELAQVGMTEEAAKKSGEPFSVHRQRLSSLPAAIIDDERDGLVKLVFSEESGGLLGAAVAAPNASDMIYACALGVRLGANVDDFRETVGIHAAYSEALNFAALH